MWSLMSTGYGRWCTLWKEIYHRFMLRRSFGGQYTWFIRSECKYYLKYFHWHKCQDPESINQARVMIGMENMVASYSWDPKCSWGRAWKFKGSSLLTFFLTAIIRLQVLVLSPLLWSHAFPLPPWVCAPLTEGPLFEPAQEQAVHTILRWLVQNLSTEEFGLPVPLSFMPAWQPPFAFVEI